MHVYGLTGGIASGKSTVSVALAGLRCPIIDADVIAREGSSFGVTFADHHPLFHMRASMIIRSLNGLKTFRVVEPGQPAWKLIITHFGRDVLLPDGHLDRPKLAGIIFQDEQKRRLLNTCTHPYIKRAMLWQVIKYFFKGEPLVVLVSPLLFESGRLLHLLKGVLVVNCTHEQQIERLMARDSISEADAIQRIEAQMPLPEKCRKADSVIDNSMSREHTQQQVMQLYEEMKSVSSFQRTIRWMLLALLLLLGGFVIKWCFY